MGAVEVQGTFNAQAFFNALAAILSKKEQVNITVTVTEKGSPQNLCGLPDRRTAE